MSVTVQQFDILKKTENSWALWDYNFPDNSCICASPCKIEPDLLRPNLHLLNNSIIFLGLNPSKLLTADYQSFHIPKSNDKILKKYIQNEGHSRLFGGFMTDLLDIEEPDSDKVKAIFEKQDNNNKKIFSEKVIENFISKIKTLNPPENKISIICFGDSCFDILCKSLKIKSKQNKQQPTNIKKTVFFYQNIQVNIYRVWHYSNYGKYQNKVVELRDQLAYLNGIL